MIPEPISIISSAIGFSIYKIIKNCIRSNKKHRVGVNENETEDIKEV